MTPTLKQLWLTVRQLQQDMLHAKNQINEERALRCNLQQLLIGHLESSAVAQAASNAALAITGTTAVTASATGQLQHTVGNNSGSNSGASSAIASGSGTGAN